MFFKLYKPKKVIGKIANAKCSENAFLTYISVKWYGNIIYIPAARIPIFRFSEISFTKQYIVIPDINRVITSSNLKLAIGFLNAKLVIANKISGNLLLKILFMYPKLFAKLGIILLKTPILLSS